MKTFYFIVLNLLGFALVAQDTVLYKHNNLPAKNWKETTHYSVFTYDSEGKIGGQLNKYLKNGQKMSETYFVDYENEIKQGEQKKWFSNEQLASSVNYNFGMRDGDAKYYSYKGFLYRETIYKKGEIVSDTSYEDPENEGKSERFTIVECMPLFPGCETKKTEQERNDCSTEKIYNHIVRETKYPSVAQDQGISGIVYVQFVVNHKGNIEAVAIQKGVRGGELLEREAIRVINNLPKMIPATQFGEYVKVQYNVPVSFKLISSKNTDKGKRSRRKKQ